MRLAAQGDLLVEAVADLPLSGAPIASAPDGTIVLAHGELTGHRHIVCGGSALLFRDDALARDIPAGLYVGHLKIAKTATLEHEQHAAISLPAGLYRVRRRRVLEPADAAILED